MASSSSALTTTKCDNLRSSVNEVFGEENFSSDHRLAEEGHAEERRKAISRDDHEYVVVYARNRRSVDTHSCCREATSNATVRQSGQ